jgi:hypothetical protein
LRVPNRRTLSKGSCGRCALAHDSSLVAAFDFHAAFCRRIDATESGVQRYQAKG